VPVTQLWNPARSVCISKWQKAALPPQHDPNVGDVEMPVLKGPVPQRRRAQSTFIQKE